MLNRKAILIKPETRELILKAMAGNAKCLEKIKHFAFRGPDNFLSVFAAGSKMIDERLPLTTLPAKMTLSEALRFREIEAGIRLPKEELDNPEITRKVREALAIREIVTSLIDHALSKVRIWNQERAVEILIRSMAFLIFCGADEKGALIDKLNQKTNIFPLESDVHPDLLNIYLTFPDGVWGRTKIYPLDENKNRDWMILRILADLWGNELPIILVENNKNILFASIEEEKECFECQTARSIASKVMANRGKILASMEETWEEIKSYRSREISPNGWDKIFVPEGTPLGTVGIRYIRFVQEAAIPPSVGLEIELKNGKILVAKINPQGVLLASWVNLFPMVSWLINSAALLYLKNLTVGGDSYIRYRVERKTSTGEAMEAREFLVSRKESRKYRYIPRDYFCSTDDREIRRVVDRKSPRFHPVRGHKRDMPLSYKPSPEAVDELKKRGYEILPNRTWIGGHNRGKNTGEEISPAPIRDISTTEELSRLLTF